MTGGADLPASELLSLYYQTEGGSSAFSSTSYPEFELYRDRSTVFSGMLAYLRVPMILGSGADAQRISGELVSPDYFNVLGIRPAAGRLLLSGETGAAVVISYGLWQSRFTSDPAVIGKAIRNATLKFCTAATLCVLTAARLQRPYER